VVAAASSHWWLSKFAERMLQLDPHASWRSAVLLGVVKYHYAAAMDPHEAADLFYRAKV
jgi:hypothetical protein